LLPLWAGLGDIALVHIGFLVAFAVRFRGTFPAENFEAYLTVVPGLSVLALILFLTYGLYDFRPHSWRATASGVVAAVTFLAVLGMAVSFAARAFALPRSILALAWMLDLFLLLVWRHNVWRVTKRLLGNQVALIVGPLEEAREVTRRIGRNGQLGYTVMGLVVPTEAETVHDWLQQAATSVAPEPWIQGRSEPTRSEPEDLPAIPFAALSRLCLDRKAGLPYLLIVTPGTTLEDKARVTILASQTGSEVLIIPGYGDLLVLDSRVRQIGDTLVFEVGTSSVPPHLVWVKRVMDISLSLVGLGLTLPLYPLIALGAKTSSPGPVFYVQDRVGLGGRTYRLWKFRTMKENAEDETGPVLATRDDARVTGVGRFLRRYRLDELPQLFNVLLGSMTLVGPRPERPEFVREYSRVVPYYEQRHLVKPGLTGLAQLHAKYDTPVEEKLRYDLLYAKRYSLLLDLRILLLTAKVILKGDESQWDDTGLPVP
jgi:lipopolysaccharide/colanic/teichoic acid biosynthesis glycosyltransferase